MKLLFASDSFKGSLTSEQTIELLTKAANEVFDDPETIGVPVADGGEGTVDAVLSAQGGERINVNVHGPLMDEVRAYYGKDGAQKLYDYGITKLLQTSDENVPLEEIMSHAEEYYYRGAVRMFALLFLDAIKELA